MTIDIPEDVALRLEQLAEQRGTGLGDLLRDMIERYAKERTPDNKSWATLADLARHAKLMNMASPGPVNTAERSREILNTEYVDYLKSRIDP